MALQIIKSPETWAPVPVRNPIEIALETDKYLLSEGKYSFIYFQFGAPTLFDDGNYFKLKINDIVYQFTFRDNPDDSGYELPSRSGQTNTVWTPILFEALKNCPIVDELFDISLGFLPGGYITLKSKNFGVDLYTQAWFGSNNSSNTIANTAIGTTGSAWQGVFDTFQPNFTTNLKLYCEKGWNSNQFEQLIEVYDFPKNEPDGNNRHYISRFRIEQLIYDYMLKIYKQNLQESLPYNGNFPHAKHLLKKFYFKYFENYGSPAVAHRIETSAEVFGMLHGIGHTSFPNRNFLNGCGLLHPGQDMDNPFTIKQYVDKDQPAWMYFFFNPSDGNDMSTVTRVFMRLYFSDNTTSEANITATGNFAVPLNSSKAFFIPAGYKQRGVGNGDTANKKCYAWDIVVEIDEEIYLTRKYVLDCCTAYKSFLMFQNSYGGYETVCISAPKQFGLDIQEGKEVERILSDSYKLHDSQFEAGVPKVRQTVKANIGWKKTSDFDILKELLMSKFVFVTGDFPNNGIVTRFIPVNIDRKSVELESEDDFEKNFSFEFSPAHAFKNFENNLWLKSK